MSHILFRMFPSLMLTLAAIAVQGQTFTFRNGVSDYTGTQDTEIRSDTSTPLGDNLEISVDQSDGGAVTEGLLRFDSLFGDGTNQIPLSPDSVIVSATLTVEQTSTTGGTIRFHRMLADWSQGTATWNSFGGNGVQADGVEAIAAADGTFSGIFDANGTKELDVTASLQAWYANPDSNLGWVIINDSTNGWDFISSEDTLTDIRPQLRVVVAPVPGPGALPIFGMGLFPLGLALSRRFS